MGTSVSMAGDSGQEFLIKPENRFIRGLWTSLFLGFIVYGGTSLSSQIFGKNLKGAPFFFGLSAFLALLAIAAYGGIWLAWLACGAETVSTRGGKLTIRYKLGPIQIFRPRFFDLVYVRDMRIEERRRKAKGKTIVNHAITFDYLGKREDLSAYLSERKAESLLAGPLRRFAQNHL
jgi:hypothetical protein